MRFSCVILDFRHVYIFFIVIMIDRLCSGECRLHAGWKTAAITSHHLPARSDDFIRFYTNPWKCMAIVSQKPGSRPAIAIVIESRWRTAK